MRKKQDGFPGNRYIHFHNSDIDKVVDRQVMTDAEEQKGEWHGRQREDIQG